MLKIFYLKMVYMLQFFMEQFVKYKGLAKKTEMYPGTLKNASGFDIFYTLPRVKFKHV